MWRKAMLYLGLGPDEEYDDYDASYDDDSGLGRTQRARPVGRAAAGAPCRPTPRRPSAIGAVRPIAPRPSPREPVAAGQTVTPAAAPACGRRSCARSAPLRARSRTWSCPRRSTRPRSWPTSSRATSPVIMNLQGADRDLSRRLIDFASGLCYGLGGQMEKVANQVYLLTPSNVEVSRRGAAAPARARLRQLTSGMLLAAVIVATNPVVEVVCIAAPALHGVHLRA